MQPLILSDVYASVADDSGPNPEIHLTLFAAGMRSVLSNNETADPYSPTSETTLAVNYYLAEMQRTANPIFGYCLLDTLPECLTACELSQPFLPVNTSPRVIADCYESAYAYVKAKRPQLDIYYIAISACHIVLSCTLRDQTECHHESTTLPSLLRRIANLC